MWHIFGVSGASYDGMMSSAVDFPDVSKKFTSEESPNKNILILVTIYESANATQQ